MGRGGERSRPANNKLKRVVAGLPQYIFLRTVPAAPGHALLYAQQARSRDPSRGGGFKGCTGPSERRRPDLRLGTTSFSTVAVRGDPRAREGVRVSDSVL